MNEESNDPVATNSFVLSTNIFQNSKDNELCKNIEVNNSYDTINNNSKNYYDSKVPLSPDNHAVGNQGFEHRKTEEMREM